MINTMVILDKLDFTSFLNSAEVVLVNNAFEFDINNWEDSNNVEINEELGDNEASEKVSKPDFVKYKLDDASIEKIVNKIRNSKINIIDYWKTNQFLKKNNLKKEDLDEVLHNIEKEDYRVNSKPNGGSSYNEAIIFVKDTKVKEFGPFELYIKLDYDSVEDDPVIVISIHSHAKSKKSNISENK